MYENSNVVRNDLTREGKNNLLFLDEKHVPAVIIETEKRQYASIIVFRHCKFKFFCM